MCGQNQCLGFFPVDAFIGDGEAVLELRKIFRQALIASVQIAFEHQADDRVIAGGALVDHVVPDFPLIAVVFVGIRVAAVNHEAGGKAGGCETFGGFFQMFLLVVRA